MEALYYSSVRIKVYCVENSEIRRIFLFVVNSFINVYFKKIFKECVLEDVVRWGLSSFPR